MKANHQPGRRQRLQSLLDEAGLQTCEAVLDGQYLRYIHRPGKGEPLLLCNGIGANLELTLPLLEALRQRPVIVVDLPGTGGSASGLFWPSFKRYAAMLMTVLARQGYSGHFSVAGVSWGGALAQEIAHRYPARVTHLILMATTPGIIMVPGRLSALRHMLTPQRYLSRRYMVRHAGTLYGGEMRRRGEHVRHHAQLMMPPSTLGYVQQLLAMYQFSSLPWLHKLSCPALVLSGEDDPLIHPLNARLLANRLPNVQLRLLPGAGHLFMTLRAGETAKLIEDFLA